MIKYSFPLLYLTVYDRFGCIGKEALVVTLDLWRMLMIGECVNSKALDKLKKKFRRCISREDKRFLVIFKDYENYLHVYLYSGK